MIYFNFAVHIILMTLYQVITCDFYHVRFNNQNENSQKTTKGRVQLYVETLITKC